VCAGEGETEDSPQKLISVLLESLFILRKVPEAAEVSAHASVKSETS